MTDRDPVNVLGELIEDSTIRNAGQIGTLASAHVAQDVIDAIRNSPALAASVLGMDDWTVQWRRVAPDGTVADFYGEQREGDRDQLCLRGPWRDVDPSGAGT